MPRKKLRTHVSKYLLDEESRKGTNADFQEAKNLWVHISNLAEKMTVLAGPLVVSDFLESLAQVVRHNILVPKAQTSPPHLAQEKEMRSPVRRKRSYSANTGRDRWEEYNALREKNFTIMDIARYAQITSTDYQGPDGLHTHRMRVKAALRHGDQILAARRALEAREWQAFRSTLKDVPTPSHLSKAGKDEKISNRLTTVKRSV